MQEFTCPLFIFISNRNVMSKGGEGKGERSFEVQTMISVQNHLEETKSCTAISLAWDRAPQLRENS